MESHVCFAKESLGRGKITPFVVLPTLLFFMVLFSIFPLAALAATWNPTQTIDSIGDVGLDTSLAVDLSGNPHISYYDSTNGDLKYVSSNGTTWSSETVDSTGNVGSYTSLAIDFLGNAHISYYDVTTGDLKYALKSGTTWSTEIIDATGNVGWYTSITLDFSGDPRISYYDVTTGDLKYASKDGPTWSKETVDATGDVGQYTSLALDILEKPHISYYDVTNQELKYASKNAAWSSETVDTTGNVGQYTSLALDLSGDPRISYYDVTNQDLKYASKNAVWNSETVDATGDVGQFTSLALDISEKPHISYYDVTNGDLKYASKNAAWSSAPVDTTGDVGRHTSFSLGSRNLHLSYYDATNGNLKYISGLASPPAKSVERVWGTTSPDTAIEISKKGWPDGSSRAAIVARDDFFTDALAGAPLAYKLRELYGNPAPILLTPSHNLYPGTAAEIQRLGVEKVYLLGGEGAVDNDVKNQLAAIPGVTVERLWGETAYGTAFVIKAKMDEIASSQNSERPTTAVITTGENFPDALVIAGPAAKKNMPILLVKTLATEVQPETKLALLGINKTIIVGGRGVILTEIEAWLNASGYPVQKRLWGQSEYDTAVDVAFNGASIFGFDWANTFVTRGDYFTDALAGGAYAARLSSPMVLVKPDAVPEITRLWLTGNSHLLFKVYLLGGTGAISNNVMTQIQGI